MTVYWNAVWSAFTAVGTVAMAVTTMWVIRQDRRRHQDSFKPICVLMPDGGVDPLSREDLLKRVEPLPNDPDREFTIHCLLKNIGTGPAMKIRLAVRFMGVAGYGPSRELSSLAPGESRGDKDHPLRIPTRLHHGFNDTDFASAAGTGWEIVLVYQDLFGKVFHTRHSKNPQEPWTVFGEGPIPAQPKPSAAQMEVASDAR